MDDFIILSNSLKERLAVFYSILLITALAALVYYFKRWLRLPADQRNHFAIRAVLWTVAVVVVGLVLAGRAHWLMGVMAGLIAVASRAVQLAQFVPMFKKLFDQGYANNQPPVHATGMSKSDAADILGVSPTATAEEVSLAHKKLMQKIHPDRGGTDALAAQINQAKEVLLG